MDAELCGCCPNCSKPWKREVNVVYVNPGNRSTNGPRSIERKHIDHGTAGFSQRLERRSTTLGFAPACKCDPGEPVPCTVFDPFNGAGTTGLVATYHGRRYIGIDLNPEYLRMSDERIRAGMKPVKVRTARKAYKQPGLFPEVKDEVEA